MWGLFSSNGKLTSSVSLQLIHQVLFVTSHSGSSSSWNPCVVLQLAPPPAAVSFVFGRVFFTAPGTSL